MKVVQLAGETVDSVITTFNRYGRRQVNLEFDLTEITAS